MWDFPLAFLGWAYGGGNEGGNGDENWLEYGCACRRLCAVAESSGSAQTYCSACWCSPTKMCGGFLYGSFSAAENFARGLFDTTHTQGVKCHATVEKK